MTANMKIRDRVLYLRLFNKKHVKSHESIMYAGSMEDAEQLYRDNRAVLPKHVYHEISQYAVDNKDNVNGS